MKIARVKKETIENIFDLLNDVKHLSNELQSTSLEHVSSGDFDVIPIMQDESILLKELCKKIANSNYEIALSNLMTLLENCADMDADTLEFNKEIITLKKLPIKLKTFKRRINHNSFIDIVVRDTQYNAQAVEYGYQQAIRVIVEAFNEVFEDQKYCKGDAKLGTNCGKCGRCVENTKEVNKCPNCGSKDVVQFLNTGKRICQTCSELWKA